MTQGGAAFEADLERARRASHDDAARQPQQRWQAVAGAVVCLFGASADGGSGNSPRSSRRPRRWTATLLIFARKMRGQARDEPLSDLGEVSVSVSPLRGESAKVTANSSRPSMACRLKAR